MWWKDAVCYQIYPRSYVDSNGDGIGDLPGIISKLDYLQWLGINALWISPFFPSPQFDWGYDVSDYTGIDPDYGTMADFDKLLEEAHRRDIRILLDLVLNHTSNQHQWFLESKSSRENPYRDWYIWRDGRGDAPPNNWESVFGGTGWEYDPTTEQYFYHFFFKEQPDLNWRNPAVHEAMFDVVRFWLDRGVDGYRLDAIGCVYEDEALRDAPPEPSLGDVFLDARIGVFDPGSSNMADKVIYQRNLPEVFTLMQDLRTLIEEHYDDRLLLGETAEVEFYGDGSDSLHSVFSFDLIGSPLLEAPILREILERRLPTVPKGAWEANTVGNHDRMRSKVYFADGEDDEARAFLALALVTFLRGTPVIYYGEEIGMTGVLPRAIEDFKDGFGVWAYHALREKRGLSDQEALNIAAKYIGRDYCRTPMQWDASEYAGFSTAEPWLPVGSDYGAGINVAQQENDPSSMLNRVRELIRVRQANIALRRGEFEMLPETDDVLAFWRRTDEQNLLVLLNMSAENAVFELPSEQLKPIYASSEATVASKKVTLAPYAAVVVE